jgi:DNA-binding NarL/FixJ family response regulator
MKPLRVLLADDHAILLEGLRRVLNRPGFEVVGAVVDGRALLQAAAELEPDLIIADISMPLLNGIEAVRQIRKQNHEVKIIFLTMHPDVTYATEALAAGASGYVLKSSAGDELLSAIWDVCKDRVYVSKAIAESVQRALEHGSSAAVSGAEQLTSRQREVLQLLVEGRSVKEIAHTLHLSPRTVEFHKYRIMEGLGVRTIAELARYAVKRGMIV